FRSSPKLVLQKRPGRCTECALRGGEHQPCTAGCTARYSTMQARHARPSLGNLVTPQTERCCELPERQFSPKFNWYRSPGRSTMIARAGANSSGDVTRFFCYRLTRISHRLRGFSRALCPYNEFSSRGNTPAFRSRGKSGVRTNGCPGIPRIGEISG